VDPRGKKYYWIGGDDLGFAEDEGTDCVAIRDGFISVTPLQVDLTNFKLLQENCLPVFSWP
jgi:5'-nucleotidase